MNTYNTYSIYADGIELLETESRKEAIQFAKTKANERHAPISIYENDATNGEQYFVMVEHPVGGES